jgi:hypothetical protein
MLCPSSVCLRRQYVVVAQVLTIRDSGRWCRRRRRYFQNETNKNVKWGAAQSGLVKRGRIIRAAKRCDKRLYSLGKIDIHFLIGFSRFLFSLKRCISLWGSDQWNDIRQWSGGLLAADPITQRCKSSCRGRGFYHEGDAPE